jgi:hypothetical protein
MSALPISVWRNNTDPQFYNLSFPSTNVRDIKGGAAFFSSIGTAGSFNANTISASMAYLSSISTTSITLDGNTLDTGGGGFGATLLLNGVAIATTSNISSIGDWAYFPAISTIDCDQRDIVDCKDIFATNLTLTNSLTSVIGGFTTLNSGNITNTSNILTNTLQTTGLINAASISTPSLKANLISTGTINVSTLLGANAAIGGISTNTISTSAIVTGSIGANSGNYSTINVSTITAGSVIFPVDDPNLVVSSITVNGNTTTQTVTVTNGGNFSGTRPNFLTGINTSGPNNFNNTNLDNCGQINAANLSLNAGALSALASGTIGLTANSGGSILTNTAINLATSNGGSSVINIEAKRNALLAYPIPLSQVNIVAEGNCPNIPVVPLTPYGGEVNIQAYQGPDPIFPLTPLTNAFAPGAIKLIAYSKGVFPGLIVESAGSILAYSGLTTPTAGLYGCSFYSALTCLSLTAGLGPALTSFPGTVYLRGDNGTKVLNGLYIDHLYPAAGYTLAISGAGGSNVTIEDCALINMTTNPVLDGGNVNGQIRNFSTISGRTVLASTINVANISTSGISVDQIYTRNININPPSTIYTTHPDLTINANLTTDELDDPQPNNLNLYASSNINIQSFTTGGGGGNINIQCGNNPSVYSVNITGDTYVSRTLNVGMGISTTNLLVSSINNAAYPPGGGGGSVSSFTNLFATNASTTNLFVSSINGAAYPPSGGGSSWVSTATTRLNMNGFNISSISTATASFLVGTKGNANASIIPTVSPLSVQNGGFHTTTRPQIEFQYEDGGGYNHYIVSQHDNTTAGSNSIDFFINTAGVGQSGSSAPGTGNTQALSIRGDEVSLFKPIDMNGNVIGDNTGTLTISSISVNIGGPDTVALAAGDLSTNYTSMFLVSTSVGIAQVGDTAGFIDINAAGNIQTAALSTINTVQNTYFSGNISKRLDGAGVIQPIIQYGEISTSGSTGNQTISIPAHYSASNSYVAFACMEDSSPSQISVVRNSVSTIEVYWAQAGGGSHTIVWQTLGT